MNEKKKNNKIFNSLIFYCMLIYNKTKQAFLEDVATNNIEDILQKQFAEILERNIGQSEYTSWQNSLKEMYFVIHNSNIPDDASICLEYTIPGSSKRIDCIIAGLDHNKKETVVIIELKQWQSIELTEKDAIVRTRFAHGVKETSHPSYQAWTYAMLLKGFNREVYDHDIQLTPCAFLHNYKHDGKIDHECYASYLEKAPLFLKTDKQKLSDFLSEQIVYGDTTQLMQKIENAEIRPSKALADNLASMLKWNQEFVMVDDQKVVFETAKHLAKTSNEHNKKVLIVEGWPWTWKSVVAINLLVDLIKNGLQAQYVTKNSAPRAVYESKLTGTLRKTQFSSLFRSSGSYVETQPNTYDALIVDEAHRLNEKSGMFANKGENQIKEIIEASTFSLFFIDEDQKVTFKDIGEKEAIIHWAEKCGAEYEVLELASQFRCNGSDGYLSWLDHVLQIRETANPTLEWIDYDFQVCSTPTELQEKIFEKNKINNKARIVAGYCWDWISKKHPDSADISFPEHNFDMKWNLASDGMLWILQPESVNEIGCIHTCQGLEVDYIGVIIGDDLIIRNGEVLVDPSKRAKTDASLRWYKTQMKHDEIWTQQLVRSIIKNTYRTLMTRWMKWCYLYCTDSETAEYFKKHMGAK